MSSEHGLTILAGHLMLVNLKFLFMAGLVLSCPVLLALYSIASVEIGPIITFEDIAVSGWYKLSKYIGSNLKY